MIAAATRLRQSQSSYQWQQRRVRLMAVGGMGWYEMVCECVTEI